MALRAVAFRTMIAISTVDQQLMDYDMLAFDGPVNTQCPSCGTSFVAFFVIEQGSYSRDHVLELQQKLLSLCNRGMHSFKRVELTE